MSNYQISSEGVIYSIQEDGSIKRVAAIEENGQLLDAQNGSNTKRGCIIVLILVCAIIGFILFVTICKDRGYYKREVATLESEIQSKNERIGELDTELSNLKTEIASVSPFVIYRVEIGNVYNGGGVETEYGNTLYSSRTMFLSPKIFYKGFKSSDYTFDVKCFSPDGTMSTGTSSPKGFSQSALHYLSEGDNQLVLEGWGNKSKGYWKKGKYRLELWCKGKCVFSKNFKIV
jgi:cell division protein FtsL